MVLSGVIGRIKAVMGNRENDPSAFSQCDVLIGEKVSKAEMFQLDSDTLRKPLSWNS